MVGVPPDRAHVVIIGGGIIGCSVAYHLTQMGWTDVVLLERMSLTGGSTWHAAGLVTQRRRTRVLTDICRRSVELYSRLESETGQATGFKQTGSVTVARTSERLEELKRATSMARTFGVRFEAISPREAGELWPMMRTDDLVGGIFYPGRRTDRA